LHIEQQELSGCIMMKLAVILCLALVQDGLADFLLKKMAMDDETFEVCSYCDERSDKLGSSVVAKELREFMTRDHIKIVVDKGDVLVKETYPNEGIPTGHSCKMTAEARNVVGTAYMIPGTTSLSPEGIIYIDETRNAIAISEVGHALNVDLDVRVYFGQMFFGHCKNVGRKTCSTNGYTEGTNHLSVNLAASNVMTLCYNGQQHLSFNVNAKVYNEVKHETYSAVQVGKKGDCDLDFFGINIGSMNKKIQEYAQRYVNIDDRFTELRSDKLVAELSNKLGAALGSEVLIPLTYPDGSPRLCNSKNLKTSCRKSCPDGFTRIGETDMCQKFFGTTKPDCSQFGKDAVLFEKAIGSQTMYWCHTPRV